MEKLPTSLEVGDSPEPWIILSKMASAKEEDNCLRILLCALEDEWDSDSFHRYTSFLRSEAESVKVGSSATSQTPKWEVETFCKSVPGIYLTQALQNTSLVAKPQKLTIHKICELHSVTGVMSLFLFTTHFHWNSQHSTDLSIRTGSWISSVSAKIPSVDKKCCFGPWSRRTKIWWSPCSLLFSQGTHRVSKPRSRTLQLVSRYLSVLSSSNLSQINVIYFKDSWIAFVPPNAKQIICLYWLLHWVEDCFLSVFQRSLCFPSVAVTWSSRNIPHYSERSKDSTSNLTTSWEKNKLF